MCGMDFLNQQDRKYFIDIIYVTVVKNLIENIRSAISVGVR